jgi:hypothetical protein
VRDDGIGIPPEIKDRLSRATKFWNFLASGGNATTQ